MRYLCKLLVLASLTALPMSMHSQENVLKIVQNGRVAFSAPTSEFDYVTVVDGLSAPTGLSGMEQNGEVSLVWEPVEGATAYSVYRNDITSGFSLLADVDVTSYTDQNPPVGEICYKVQAKGNDLESMFSQAIFIGVPETRTHGYEFVDLGLPSGVKWATMNVGAFAPEGYGNYYSWGEVTVKSTYNSSTSQTYGKDNTWLASNGYIDSEGTLLPAKDAATQAWSGSWRMPTQEELNELKDNCQMYEVSLNGILGKKFEGPNGNWIFIPYAGRMSGSTLQYSTSEIYLWGASADASSSNVASFLRLVKYSSPTIITISSGSSGASTHRVVITPGASTRIPTTTNTYVSTVRCHGLPIRPVTD